MYYPLPCLLVARGLQIGLESDEKIAYSPFGAPARYSYLAVTRVILARNKGHFQREASCRKRNMNEGFGHGTSSWATGLIVAHAKVNLREYGRNVRDVEHRTGPSSSPVDARLSPDDPGWQVRRTALDGFEG